mmetsp:Transcript_19228/g.35257  ORF Transcript_19228/g.35257 Transcript_19228/m.35257 type:complete len:455 (-) Transcript_19228:2927-4291(-)
MKGVEEPLVGTGKISFTRALLSVLYFASPTILSYFFQMGIEIINLLYMGNIDKYRLDGIGLANMWGNITGISLGWGLAGGLDTLCSQANGSRDYKMVGTWFQRGVFVMSMFMIPISIAWLYTKEVLIAINVQEDIAQYSYNYLSRVLPGLWFFLLFDCYRRYLGAQGMAWPFMIVNLIATLMHVVWDWLLIVHYQMYEVGAGYATCITYVSIFVLLVLFNFMFGFDRKTNIDLNFDHFFPQVCTYLTYAIPAAFLLVFDFINYEITQLEANMIGLTEQAAHVSMLNTNSLLFMISMGLSITTSGLVGNFVGEGCPKKAQMYAKAACVLVLIIKIPIQLALVYNREAFSSIYTYDEDVRAIVEAIIPAAAAFNIFDALQLTLSGILRGLGRQKQASIVIFISYYFFALPTGYFLAFYTTLGVVGLWLGLLFGAMLACTELGRLIYKAEWKAVTLV